MLAVSVKDLSLLTADVSVAFVHAPVEAEACDLVLLPANRTIKGCRVLERFLQFERVTLDGYPKQPPQVTYLIPRKWHNTKR